VALAALLIVLPGAPTQAQDEADHFLAGYQRFQRGEYDAAIVELQQATEAQPDFESAWFFLGAAQFELANQSLAPASDTASRDYRPAQASLRKATELAPSRPEIRMYLGRIEEARGKYDAAGQWYREELSLRRVVDRHAAEMALARLSYQAGRTADASAALQAILDQEPDYVEARYYLGLCQAADKQPAKAVDTYKAAAKTLDGWLGKIYHLLRVEFLEVYPDQPDKASRVVAGWDQLRKELWQLRESASRSPKDTLEEITQQYARAEDFALGLHLWPQLNKALGDAYLGQQDWAAARNAYRQAMRPREGEGSAEDPDCWSRIGRAYFLNGKQTIEQQGLLMSAVDMFDAAIGDQISTTTAAGGTAAATATDPTQWDGYARALYVAGINRDAPLADMEPPVEPDPVLGRVFDGLGEVYLFQASTYVTDKERGIKSHTFDDAITAFDKALLFYPTLTVAKLHKAQAMLNRGARAELPGDRQRDYAAARRILESDALVTKGLPRDLEADLWGEVSRAYIGLDDLKKAEKASRAALALNSKHRLALNMLGLTRCLPPNKDYVGAMQAFSDAIAVAPKDFESYMNLGNALYGMRSWGRAEREYERALNLIPETSVANTGSQRPYVLFLIARAQHEQGNYEKAVATLGKALQMRTDFYEALRLLAASYAGQSKWRAAEEALQGALRVLSPDNLTRVSSTHAHLGQVYEIQGRSHEAVAEYRQALAASAGNLAATDGLRRLLAQERPAGTSPAS
jgi:tetratricopeptide (TPR) repeat protein